MSVKLRLATAADIAALMEMRREFYCHDPASLNDERDRQAVESLVNNPALGRVWLLETESGIGGFAILTFCYSIEFGGRFALLDELFVVSSQRGRGVGTATLEQIEAATRAEDVVAVRLEVNRANPGAERLYHRFGFEEEDRNLMTKWLIRG